MLFCNTASFNKKQAGRSIKFENPSNAIDGAAYIQELLIRKSFDFFRFDGTIILSFLVNLGMTERFCTEIGEVCNCIRLMSFCNSRLNTRSEIENGLKRLKVEVDTRHGYFLVTVSERAFQSAMCSKR
ncbi:hypothetical protein F753_04295 [Stutzerimonas chloritidismutans AW-1]|uniref:Uncharacterized protein n=1 Tax=Stutzerimonas chloritidismutans AW-1 TaxID=1263865 RepID=V4QG07_STUCH|nr:hypothetical protein F753_04295 [Stutzerimonas chloritidismutans AW-1]